MSIPRQRIRSATGQVLERGYIYLPPDTWKRLEGLATAFAMPCGVTIAALINASEGPTESKEVNVSKTVNTD